MKVVLDTNIWISGLLLPNSQAGKVIKAWEHAKFTIVTSKPILDEIRKVLNYSKIKKRIQWNDEQIEEYASLLEFLTDYLPELSISIHLDRDPDDSTILATLTNSNADYLITGDNDLLCLRDKCSIITLAEFCDLML